METEPASAEPGRTQPEAGRSSRRGRGGGEAGDGAEVELDAAEASGGRQEVEDAQPAGAKSARRRPVSAKMEGSRTRPEREAAGAEVEPDAAGAGGGRSGGGHGRSRLAVEERHGSASVVEVEPREEA